MRTAKGGLALVLHAHLPYVRHPEHRHFLEETWLFEALTECYLPLLELWQRLAEQGVPYRMALSVSPPLAAMLADPLLEARYLQHLDCLLALAEGEAARYRPSSPWHRLARMYGETFLRRREQAAGLRDGVLPALRRLADAGHLELMASAATHAYLPTLTPHREAVGAQVNLGLADFRKRFLREPRGFWLPECGLDPSWEPILAAAGVGYVILDAHGVLHARPRPAAGVYAPVRSARSGIAAFARDPASSAAVWSAEHGYPGDPAYRDFYRDIGFERDVADCAPWLAGGARAFTGLKYYRVTGPTAAKEPYDPDAARRRAREHAEDFVGARRRQAARLHGLLGRPPILVAPYDAELFGHWWYEGPCWLEAVLRLTCRPETGPTDSLELTTPGRWLEAAEPLEKVRLHLSSWGEGGYSYVWLNEGNDWIFRRLDDALNRMKALAASFPRPSALERRALNQAARELLLAQSSDWAFLVRTGSALQYACRRIRSHLARFRQLEWQLRTGSLDPVALARWEWRTPLFPDVDYRMFAPRRRAAREKAREAYRQKEAGAAAQPDGQAAR